MLTTDRAAEEIHRTLVEGRTLRSLSAPLRPTTLVEAYLVQSALCERLVPERGELAGYKIALTTLQAQEVMGIAHPCSGVLFADRIYQGDVRLRHSRFVRAAVECEVAMKMGSDLPVRQDPYSLEEVSAAVESCMAAIELVDDTNADYEATSGLDLVSWNEWNWGLVIGPACEDWRSFDLAELRVAMTIGSHETEVGSGADVLGHPLNALHWLVNHLGARGHAMRRGMLVTSGAIIGPRWPLRGERVSVEIEGMGTVCVDFE
jgi:2-keto-4-pentenoate hydratase